MQNSIFNNPFSYNSILKIAKNKKDLQEELYNKQKNWFYTFLNNTDQKKKFLEFLKQKSEELELVTEWNTKVLDVGTGNGASLIPLLEEIVHSENPWDKKKFTEVNIDEHNLGVMLDFVTNYCIDGYRFMNLNINENYNKNNSFDLITASHVFYYIDNWSENISDLINSLKPNGKMIIAQTSKQGFLYKIRNEFFKKLDLKELNEKRPHSGEELFDKINEIIDNKKESYVTKAIESLINPDIFAETEKYYTQFSKNVIIDDLTKKGLPIELINKFLESQFGKEEYKIPKSNELKFKQELADEYTSTLENLITIDDFKEPCKIILEKYLIESETILTQENFNEILSFILRTDFNKIKPEMQKEILSFVANNSTTKEGAYILPFKDVGIIVKKTSNEDYISLGTPFDLFDCADITTRHISNFLLKFLENELGTDLKNEGRERYRNYLKQRGLNDNEIRELGLLRHTNDKLQYDYLRKKGFNQKDLSDYYDYRLMNSFLLDYERLLYYDFVLLDLFLSHPYHSQVVCTYAKDLHTGKNARTLPLLMQPMAYKEEINTHAMPSIDERRNTFIKAFESMYLLNKNFDYSLKKTMGEYVINECVRVQKPVKPFNELLKDYQSIYKKYGHDKIVIPCGQNSLVANMNFDNLKTDLKREKLIYDHLIQYAYRFKI